MKQIIRLTESDLHRIVKESVKRILEGENVLNHAHSTPTGGWDSYAYAYDDALDNAESIEDWDDRMAKREKDAREYGNCLLHRHPQKLMPYGGKSVGADEYVHPEWFGHSKEETLDKLEKDANDGRRMAGFPI